ncbi:hypothetical protein HaLaN_27501, partial [Haematococcus lacustris]
MAHEIHAPRNARHDAAHEGGLVLMKEETRQAASAATACMLAFYQCCHSMHIHIRQPAGCSRLWRSPRLRCGRVDGCMLWPVMVLSCTLWASDGAKWSNQVAAGCKHLAAML